MAANTLIHVAPGFAIGEQLTSAQFNIADARQADAPKRSSTKSGYKRLSLCAPHVTAGQVVEGFLGQIKMNNTAVGNYVSFPLIGLVDGHVLTAVKMYFTPKGGHGGGGPATLPQIVVYTQTTAGATAPLGAKNYVWNGAVDPVQYQAGFSLEVAAIAHTIDLETYEYMVQVLPEDGAGALGDLKIHAVCANMTIDTAAGGIDHHCWLLA
jgi:hypothetical protein